MLRLLQQDEKKVVGKSDVLGKRKMVRKKKVARSRLLLRGQEFEQLCVTTAGSTFRGHPDVIF